MVFRRGFGCSPLCVTAPTSQGPNHTSSSESYVRLPLHVCSPRRCAPTVLPQLCASCSQYRIVLWVPHAPGPRAEPCGSVIPKELESSTGPSESLQGKSMWECGCISFIHVPPSQNPGQHTRICGNSLGDQEERKGALSNPAGLASSSSEMCGHHQRDKEARPAHGTKCDPRVLLIPWAGTNRLRVDTQMARYREALPGPVGTPPPP